jgi:hypothetical protein
LLYEKWRCEMYTVDEAFQILNDLKLTSNKESVRRWLRQGTIKGISPSSKKEGWKITKESLDTFIKERLPESYTTSDVTKADSRAREKMWIELANKNIWEGYVELKKAHVREGIQHRGYSKELEDAVWEACEKNKRGYSKPRIPYLLEAFGFDGKRLLLDQNFADKEEQIVFSIIEYVRKQIVNKKL